MLSDGSSLRLLSFYHSAPVVVQLLLSCSFKKLFGRPPRNGKRGGPRHSRLAQIPCPQFDSLLPLSSSGLLIGKNSSGNFLWELKKVPSDRRKNSWTLEKSFLLPVDFTKSGIMWIPARKVGESKVNASRFHIYPISRHPVHQKMGWVGSQKVHWEWGQTVETASTSRSSHLFGMLKPERLSQFDDRTSPGTLKVRICPDLSRYWICASTHSPSSRFIPVSVRFSKYWSFFITR